MPRKARRPSGLEKTVRRTVKRASTTARRRANTGGTDLVQAVHTLIKALPVTELEKRLTGLEKSVAKLEGEIRKAARKVGIGVRSTPSRRGRTAKRASAKGASTTRATTKRTTTRKAGTGRTTAKRTTRRKTTTRRTGTAID
jgi:hypothetical protein